MNLRMYILYIYNNLGANLKSHGVTVEDDLIVKKLVPPRFNQVVVYILHLLLPLKNLSLILIVITSK